MNFSSLIFLVFSLYFSLAQLSSIDYEDPLSRFVRNSLFRTQRELFCSEAFQCEFKPTDQICATNGRTYKNECYFNCAKQTYRSLSMNYNGACPKQRVHFSPSERPSSYKKDPTHSDYNRLKEQYEEELGNYGKTGNPTNSHRQNIRSGIRNPHCDTWALCPWCAEEENLKWIPFCGNDGYTYDNICELQCASARCYSSDHPSLIKFEGVCDGAHHRYFSQFQVFPNIPSRVRVIPTEATTERTTRYTTTETTTTPRTTTTTTTTPPNPVFEYHEGINEGYY